MEERKDAAASTGAGDKAETGGTPKRDAEATSSETLSDVEETEKVGAGGGGSGSGDGGALEGSSPRPTSGEGGGGRADGSDTGGPM